MYPDSIDEVDAMEGREAREPSDISSVTTDEEETNAQADSEQAQEALHDKPSLVAEYVTPGKLLKTSREKAGLNRARVGQSLGLTEGAVKNLETNSFDLFPGSVYVRGYLKNYARLVGEDEIELIAIYDRYCADHQLDNGKCTPDLTALPASKGSQAKVIALVAGVLVILVVATIFAGIF